VKTTINDFRVVVPRESLIQRAQCSYCGNFTNRPVGKVDEAEGIELVECLNCLLVSTNFFPNNQFLDSYYKTKFPDYVEKYNPNNKSKVTFSKPNRFASRLKNLLPKNFFGLRFVRILDFGGADGSLALAFANLLSKDTRVEITVVDFGQDLAQSIRSNVTIKKIPVLPEQEKFDLIIASASLEMVPNFGQTLRFLLGALADEDSAIYVRTNFIHPLRRFLPFLDFSFPAHLHDIGPGFWRIFSKLESEHYQVLKSETPISELDFGSFPFRWIVATGLKFPSRLEVKMFPTKLMRHWIYVGSWEVVISKKS
jgi:hypothetical protein